jgi:hypothetical protein
MLENDLVNPPTKVEFQNRLEKGASYASGLAHILKYIWLHERVDKVVNRYSHYLRRETRLNEYLHKDTCVTSSQGS